MWGTRTLERARRRLGLRARAGDESVSEISANDPLHPTGGVTLPETTLSVALTRAEKDRFAAALATRLGETARLDTPARVASALAVAIDRVGGRGRPHVVRNPAGLYAPEYWHVSIHGADDLARAEVEHLAPTRMTEL